MRFPLIVASRVQEDTEYPRVVLRAGRWKFSHDATSSEVFIRTSESDVELHEELVLTQHTSVQVVCRKAGTEPSITVYAWLSA